MRSSPAVPVGHASFLGTSSVHCSAPPCLSVALTRRRRTPQPPRPQPAPAAPRPAAPAPPASRPRRGARRAGSHGARQAVLHRLPQRSRARPAGSRSPPSTSAKASEHADVAEKMIRKLRAGMMPPAGARRPDEAALDGARRRVSRRGSTRRPRAIPNPGSRPFQRLNRAEYARAVRDLLDLDVDVTALLPPDTISDGFDNVADAQSFSPTLMEGYLRAASRITALAVGDPDGAGRREQLQAAEDRLAAAARRRRAARHARRHLGDAHLPRRRRLRLPHGSACRTPAACCSAAPPTGEQLEVSIDGERVALLRHRSAA